MLLNAFWGALRASERVLVDVPGAYGAACSMHLFVNVRRRARGVPINIQTHVFEISRRLWQSKALSSELLSAGECGLILYWDSCVLGESQVDAI